MFKSKSDSPTYSAECLAAVECARVAFFSLGLAKSPAQDSHYDYQLENGMSAFIGKLLALQLHDQALKDMRVLKRRLDSLLQIENAKLPACVAAKSAPAESISSSASVAELLNFRGELHRSSLPIAATLQIQVLKLVCATKKPACIEALVPMLQEKNPSSPLNLLLKLADGGEKQIQKAARQLASVTQTLLSMLPSISTQEDAIAAEPRLSPTPLVAFELQALAFRAQLRWWELAGHQGSIDDEVLAPFSRCIRAFARRFKSDDKLLLYRHLATEYEALMEMIRVGKYVPSTSSKSPLSTIYQVLGSIAHSARQYEGACCWFESLKASLCEKSDSAALICSVSARCLAAALKKPELDAAIKDSMQQVTDFLNGNLSGTVAELNELLESMSAVRRSVVGLLMKELDLGKMSMSSSTDETTGALLKKFILQYPRFVRRWMGTPPGKDAPAKLFLQFDQRRQLIMQSINQTLDAALMVVKCEIQSGALGWQSMDDVLQHCLGLLDSASDLSASPARLEQSGSYRAKISTLYFSKFVELRKISNRSKDDNKQLLQSLSRSIDTVKEQSSAVKDKAQLSMKLEIFADLCKRSGRSEDAIGTLRSICTSMVEDGVLSDVAIALANLPPVLAWAATEKASSLSRTLRSIAKLDKSWNDWTFFLPERERAAVLEHLMHLSAEASSPTQALQLHDPSPSALLRIYTLDKYPIRRFRVLLHLLQQNIGEEAEAADILAELGRAAEQIQKKDKAEDGSLSQFIPHLQTCYSSMKALAHVADSIPFSVIRDDVSCWKGMLESCASKEDLYGRIDSPQVLIEFLQVLNTLANLRGEGRLQIAILELAISLSKAAAEYCGLSRDSVILNQCQLASQYVSIGRFSQASKTLGISEELLNQNHGVSPSVVVDLYLSQAEYHAGIGNTTDALDFVEKANGICRESCSSWAHSKLQANLVLSMTALIQSNISLQTGDVEGALLQIKSSVRTLSHEWAKLEATLLGSDASISETSDTSIDVRTPTVRTSGPRFWGLAAPLLRCLLHISSVYAHIGMFQETVYYADSASKLAESTQSDLYRAQVAAWTGSVQLKAGKLSKALETLEAAKAYMPRDDCSSRVQFARRLGELYSEAGDEDGANRYFSIAEETLRLLGGDAGDHAHVQHSSTQGAARKPAPVSRRATTTTRTTKPRVPAAAARDLKRKTTAKGKLQPTDPASHLPKDVYQLSMLSGVSLSRAMGFLQKKDWSSALLILDGVRELPKLSETLSLERVVSATTLLGHSMDQMISDPVFSVMQDSTISFPAVASGSDGISTDRSSLAPSPHRRGRAATLKPREKSCPAFADALRRAQEILVEAHGSTLSTSDSATVHRLSTLLQNTVILLSATTVGKARAIPSSALATVAVDLARNTTWMREKSTIKAASRSETPANPINSSNSTPGHGSGSSPDIATFSKTFIEPLPQNWNVISISLSNNRRDLSITKMQAGESPFILRLPLERANSRDADSEVFGFEQGREELLDIIKHANETSHSARDFSAKGERNAWWAEREALDTRLKDLLFTIETTWLGGFKGVFSQHKRQPDLLARFQKSFQQILGGSLPSRNRLRGKQRSSRTQSINLDPRILDLFIGLGDPTNSDNDYDEALNDLLYFVIDILQFHGERNAYDEIDFDAMVVETYDALRGYYSEARSDAEKEDGGAHTILVLDKQLHAFPWESLPCMAGLAVSRVPSLACLRQVMEACGVSSNSSGGPAGHVVSRHGGTYILNPSSDLQNTQEFFQPSFQTLEGWDRIVNEAPREAEFEEALSSSNILLYFGHGSGAQYVRGKTIRRLERCKPVTFLMGCSSASLAEAGEFECYGPVWNYMLAGCPAVVGTLWDVTDRDIDRFAGRAFEEWGLFARGTFGQQEKRRDKGNSSSRSRMASRNGGDGAARECGHVLGSGDDVAGSGAPLACRTAPSEKSPSIYSSSSLPEALAKARGACKFRYLNAAAVVVYGIPAYVARDC